jgi:DNA-binding transcriptional regulator YiaG
VRKAVTALRRTLTFSTQAAQPTAERYQRFLHAPVARQLLPLPDARAYTQHAERNPPMEENAGNLIRGLRQKLGMTQEEFAHEIAVTVSTVNRWENAHAEPSKLAWKAIQDLARKRGLPEDVALRAALEN